ncbi:MAG: hypothetical protein H6587_05845 [Flavobacteriales bacterium]|nr:hypothetical protein [Flavobacteriales bacterium]MCB9364073.1 hypothetical protein [Flavobacteriales bacterium]
MDLDLGTAISGGIFIVLCILPFALMYIKRKKNEKQFLQSLLTIAKQQNCQISQYDVFGVFGIGIDQTKNVVFFYRKTKDITYECFANLSAIKSCEIINTSSIESTQKIIEKLELRFYPVAIDQQIIKMEFFNRTSNIQLCGELQLIEKWSAIINNQLKTK